MLLCTPAVGTGQGVGEVPDRPSIVLVKQHNTLVGQAIILLVVEGNLSMLKAYRPPGELYKTMLSFSYGIKLFGVVFTLLILQVVLALLHLTLAYPPFTTPLRRRTGAGGRRSG